MKALMVRLGKLEEGLVGLLGGESMLLQQGALMRADCPIGNAAQEAWLE